MREVRIDQVDWGRKINIAFMTKHRDGSVDVAYPSLEQGTLWTVKKFKDGEPIEIDGLITLPTYLAEKLYQALGEIFTPKGPTATEQELKATKYHLEDMRRMALQGIPLESDDDDTREKTKS